MDSNSQSYDRYERIIRREKRIFKRMFAQRVDARFSIYICLSRIIIDDIDDRARDRIFVFTRQKKDNRQLSRTCSIDHLGMTVAGTCWHNSKGIRNGLIFTLYILYIKFRYEMFWACQYTHIQISIYIFFIFVQTATFYIFEFFVKSPLHM